MHDEWIPTITDAIELVLSARGFRADAAILKQWQKLFCNYEPVLLHEAARIVTSTKGDLTSQRLAEAYRKLKGSRRGPVEMEHWSVLDMTDDQCAHLLDMQKRDATPQEIDSYVFSIGIMHRSKVTATSGSAAKRRGSAA